MQWGFVRPKKKKKKGIEELDLWIYDCAVLNKAVLIFKTDIQYFQ